MQIRWQFPLRLKQTQVSPLPIHADAGEPHVVAWSVYNQSGDFPIQPFFLLLFQPFLNTKPVSSSSSSSRHLVEESN